MTDEDKALYLSTREPEMDIVSPQTKSAPINYFKDNPNIEKCTKYFLDLIPEQDWVVTKKKAKEHSSLDLVEIKTNKAKSRNTPKPWKANWTDSETSKLIEMSESNMPWYEIGMVLKRSESSLRSKYQVIKNDRKKEEQGVPLLP